MTDYTQNTNFTAKDSLASGTPAKKILGAEIDAELSEISTAISTKVDTFGSLAIVTPNFDNDYAAIYDASTVDDRRVLLRTLSPIPASVVIARGNSSQTGTGWEEIDVFTTTTYDEGHVYNGSGRIQPGGSEGDGLWLMYGKIRISSGIAAGDIIRLSVTRFDSDGTAHARQYIEQEAVGTADNMLQVIGAHAITFASGDYIALEAFSDSASWSINTTSLNMLVAFKLLV